MCMPINEINRPTDAMFCLYGVYFKVGIHGKIFKWDGFEWLLANMTHDEVLTELAFFSDKSHKECFCINNFYKGQLKKGRSK